MSSLRRFPLLIVGAALVVSACSSGAASPPASTPNDSADPSTPPSPSAVSGLEHPTGADEIVLRYEEGGGFMMPEFVVTMAPIFTLYGDGTVVFRNPDLAPPPTEDGIFRNPPFRIAKLDEQQIQSLLDFAANDGALGVARDQYEHNGIADAGTAIFTINAGGREKTVSVYALGIEGPGTPDEAIRRQFQALAGRLRDFDEGGSVPTDEYVPHGWRGILMESPGAPGEVLDWPWSDLAPADFEAPADPNVGSFPMRVLTADDLAALELGELNGGAQQIYVNGPDGKIYSLALRPLLPDEEA